MSWLRGDGETWADWVNLDGTLRAAPECVSQGDEIDCFAADIAAQNVSPLACDPLRRPGLGHLAAAWRLREAEAGLSRRARAGDHLRCPGRGQAGTPADGAGLWYYLFDGTIWQPANVPRLPDQRTSTLRPMCADTARGTACFAVDTTKQLWVIWRDKDGTWGEWEQVAPGVGIAETPHCLASGVKLDCFSRASATGSSPPPSTAGAGASGSRPAARRSRANPTATSSAAGSTATGQARRTSCGTASSSTGSGWPRRTWAARSRPAPSAWPRRAVSGSTASCRAEASTDTRARSATARSTEPAIRGRRPWHRRRPSARRVASCGATRPRGQAARSRSSAPSEETEYATHSTNRPRRPYPAAGGGLGGLGRAGATPRTDTAPGSAAFRRTGSTSRPATGAGVRGCGRATASRRPRPGRRSPGRPACRGWPGPSR